MGKKSIIDLVTAKYAVYDEENKTLSIYGKQIATNGGDSSDFDSLIYSAFTSTNFTVNLKGDLTQKYSVLILGTTSDFPILFQGTYDSDQNLTSFSNDDELPTGAMELDIIDYTTTIPTNVTPYKQLIIKSSGGSISDVTDMHGTSYVVNNVATIPLLTDTDEGIQTKIRNSGSGYKSVGLGVGINANQSTKNVDAEVILGTTNNQSYGTGIFGENTYGGSFSNYSQNYLHFQFDNTYDDGSADEGTDVFFASNRTTGFRAGNPFIVPIGCSWTLTSEVDYTDVNGDGKVWLGPSGGIATYTPIVFHFDSQVLTGTLSAITASGATVIGHSDNSSTSAITEILIITDAATTDSIQLQYTDSAGTNSIITCTKVDVEAEVDEAIPTDPTTYWGNTCNLDNYTSFIKTQVTANHKYVHHITMTWIGTATMLDRNVSIDIISNISTPVDPGTDNATLIANYYATFGSTSRALCGAIGTGSDSSTELLNPAVTISASATEISITYGFGGTLSLSRDVYQGIANLSFSDKVETV